MKRREFIAGLGSAAAWPVAARAQQSERVRLVGILEPGRSGEATLLITAFKDALARLGWREGGNIRVEYREAENDTERAHTCAAELVSMTPDVVLAANAQMVQILQEHSRNIPIVFVTVPDHVVGALVGNIARPTGNTTGFINFNSSMAGKWMQLLKELSPGTERVLVLLHLGNPTAAGYLHAIEAAAAYLGVKVLPASASDAEGIDLALAAFAKQSGGGLIVPPSSLATSNQRRIIELSFLHRLPALYPYPEFVVAGGLTSYGFDRADSHRQAASYVDRILRGDKPADLPVQAPTKFELVINLKTAKALRLTVPPNLLALADEVIE